MIMRKIFKMSSYAANFCGIVGFLYSKNLAQWTKTLFYHHG